MASAAADFERIYRRHARDVYRFALSVVRNPLEAEDVTQTTFLNAFRALERGDRPDRPRSWLFAIAHNAIRSRDRWTLRRPQEVPLDAAEHRLAASPDDAPLVADLFRALGDLPSAQREAIALRELQGRTYPEIAEVLGVSVGAVESLIGRARRALRAQRDRIGAIVVLRRLCEQGDAGVSGLAVKASVVAAAAAALAGGMAVETHVAGPTPDASAATPLSAAAVPRAGRTAHAVSRAVAPQPPAPVRTTTASASTVQGTTAPPAVASTTAASVAAPAPAPTATTATVAQAAAATATAAATTVSTVTTATTATAALVSTPTATAPAVSVPAVTVPAVTTPIATTPAVTTPAVTTPAVTTPAVTVPAVTVPAVTVP